MLAERNPPPGLCTVVYVKKGDYGTGLKFISGIAKILAERTAPKGADAKAKSERAAKILEDLRAEISIHIYLGPKDLAQTIAARLAASLADWSAQCSRPIRQIQPSFSIEVSNV